jgi:hypothetical protein
MTSNITGRLLNARRVNFENGKCILVGDVYEHISPRFPDGSEIRTSPIVHEDGEVISTRNSIYEVESWHPSEMPA